VSSDRSIDIDTKDLQKIRFKDVSDIAKAPEARGGRLKTLHPAVHVGFSSIYLIPRNFGS
jgi:AICAR transformylase/IMP cyclohydrolase PurH